MRFDLWDYLHVLNVNESWWIIVVVVLEEVLPFYFRFCEASPC